MAHLDAHEWNQLAVDLGAAASRALPQVRAAVQKTAADIKADAQAFCPVDTGNLRSSISYETRVRATDVYAEVGPTAEYGVWVEEGTSTRAPQAYLGPAFDRRASALEDALGRIGEAL